MAVWGGTLKRADSRIAGLRERFPRECSCSGWGNDIEGAAAEIAFCKYYKLYWTVGLRTFHKADAGGIWAIRSTSMEKPKLKFYHVKNGNKKPDNPDHNYVLITGKMPTFYIHGFIQGHEIIKRFADHPEWEISYDNVALYVPKSELQELK